MQSVALDIALRWNETKKVFCVIQSTDITLLLISFSLARLVQFKVFS